MSVNLTDIAFSRIVLHLVGRFLHINPPGGYATLASSIGSVPRPATAPPRDGFPTNIEKGYNLGMNKSIKCWTIAFGLFIACSSSVRACVEPPCGPVLRQADAKQSPACQIEPAVQARANTDTATRVACVGGLALTVVSGAFAHRRRGR